MGVVRKGLGARGSGLWALVLILMYVAERSAIV